jgi:hypothetical protein
VVDVDAIITDTERVQTFALDLLIRVRLPPGVHSFSL